MNRWARDISSHSFRSSDELLFDANVWLIIDGPQGGSPHRMVHAYSAAFKAALAARSKIHLDVLILSEFINRYARIEHGLVPSAGAPFKKFRQSSAFKSVAQAIGSATRRILSHCQMAESGITQATADTLLIEFSKGDSDFNDQVLAELCKSRKLTLVTDDADFKSCGMPILTANQRLLR